MIKRAILAAFIFCFLNPGISSAASLYNDSNRFAYGAMKILAAPFQLPMYMLKGTMTGPPLLGTIGGTLGGTFKVVADLTGGLFDMAAAASPYAKYALLV